MLAKSRSNRQFTRRARGARPPTTRFDVLKQGIVTIVAVPALVLAAGSLLLSFTAYPRRSEAGDDETAMMVEGVLVVSLERRVLDPNSKEE